MHLRTNFFAALRLTGGLCGRAVNTSNQSGSGPRVQASPVELFPQTRNFTPLCLCSPVYKWVPATYCCLGVNPAMDYHPVQGEEALLIGLLHATETGNKLRPCGPWACVHIYPFLPTANVQPFETVNKSLKSPKHSYQYSYSCRFCTVFDLLRA